MTSSPDLLAALLKHAAASGATAADAIMVESTDLSVSWRMGKQEGLERSENKGLGLRVWVGEAQASVSTSDLSESSLKELAGRAVAMAKVASADPLSTLAPESLLCRKIQNLDLYDSYEPDAASLLRACAEAEEAALAVKGITNSMGAEASYSASMIHLATSHGFAGSYRVSSHVLSMVALAGVGTGMERDYDYTTSRFYSDLEKPETIGRHAAAYALRRMNPRKATTCQVPVIYDPRVSRGLLSSVAGAINGAAIARGTSFLKDKMGKAIFGGNITVIDDPHILRGLGSKPFDGEGVKNSNHALVENGVLQSWLLDVRSANKLGLTSTGHASRGLSSPPSPSSTNLYMQAGTLTPRELMRDIKSGFYITDTFGSGVNLVTGDYSQGASGLWIENGELAHSVSEVTVAGKLDELMMRLTPANDLVFRYGTNAPSLRIEGVTVAGK